MKQPNNNTNWYSNDIACVVYGIAFVVAVCWFYAPWAVKAGVW